MKAEKVFLYVWNSKEPLIVFESEAQKYLLEISKNIEADFFSNLSAHFTHAEQTEITKLAAQKLHEQLTLIPNPVPFSQLKNAWNQVCQDYHQNQHWGFIPHKKTAPAPIIENPEQKKIQKQLRSYIWTAFQSLIILKVTIYYFGLKFAKDTSTENKIILICAIAFSAGSLLFFAIRKSKNE